MNPISITHCAPIASVAGAAGHGFADVASENAPVVIAISEIASGASPELVNVTDRVALALIAWLANAAVVLERAVFGVSKTVLLRLLNTPPKYRFPSGVTTTPTGVAKLPSGAWPLSPANAKSPVPAN